MLEKGLGISGVLHSNGDFEECEWGKHYEILQRLDKTDSSLKYSVVCLSSKKNKHQVCGNITNSGSYMVYEQLIGMSDEQVDWLEKHKEYMDSNQKEIYNMIVEMNKMSIKI